jgi:DNA-binding winged helix-turn-helix (wHTH) protein
MEMSSASEMSEPNYQGQCSPADVERTVSIISESEEFSRSSRLMDILQFLVSETMAGRAERLKGFVIATQVLGKTASFDATQDSIVRVEVARLRTALKLFYSRGVETPVVIDIPKGGYRLLITAAAHRKPDEIAATIAMPQVPWQSERPDRASAISRWIMIVAAVGLAMLGSVLMCNMLCDM